ncbi:MAG: excinuclease ABC subunit UvrC [Oscillospiraceae bacterium]|nr:excinuclease ABC subunit UvrC [Candidatus Ruminococcus equi]
MSEKLKELRKKAMALPLSPGVYIMKNKSGEIIYIGKAKALKNRVSQYFGSQNNHVEKVRRMVENVDDFEYIITDSEFESLILECSLIKQHTPKYNILLKDDKGYSYIRVSNDEWRRLSYVLQKKDDGAEYIGPYKSSYYVKTSVEQAQKIFMLPTCNRRFPEDFKKQRPCLNFHIKQCCAPCRGKMSKKEYDEHIDSAIDFLKGGSAKTIRKMTEKMQEASEKLDFEQAAKYRDIINAAKRMQDKQKVVNIDIDECDAIALAIGENKGSFEVFRFSCGRLYDRENFIIDDIGDEETAREEFLLRYYSIREVPKKIFLDADLNDAEVLEQWLSDKRDKKSKKVYLLSPKKGVYKDLVDMCRKNAFESLAQQSGVTGKQLSVLEELKDLLGLDTLPRYIESYDISNLAGSENVAGMVVFEDAKPKKSAYRKFKIKSFEGQDDYSSMREVMTRRIEEYKKGENDGFSRLPDLILLDGGKGQVSAVKPLLVQAGLDIPLFGMVKDDKHRTRAITNENGEIEIKRNRRVFSFVTSIQDEVHRFAISFHHNRRKKMLGISLTKIDGIGEKRAKELLRYFRTVKNIEQASLKELENAPSMTHDSALNVYRYFHTEEEL